MIWLSKVKGQSMSPLFTDGDYLLSISTKLAKLNLGNVVIINHPAYGYIVKEISRKVEKGFFVQGTHPMSTDSQSIGLITPTMIHGKVILKISSKNLMRHE
jgi:nickel-type superoxide dismutase maturation protease